MKLLLILLDRHKDLLGEVVALLGKLTAAAVSDPELAGELKKLGGL